MKKTQSEIEKIKDIQMLEYHQIAHDLGMKNTIFTKIKSNPSDRSKKFNSENEKTAVHLQNATL